MTNFTSSDPGGSGFIDPEAIVGGLALSEGMKVADFGAGAGYFTIAIAKRVGKSGTVTAIDVLNSALDTIRNKAKAQGLENVEIVRSNLEVLGSGGLEASSLDMVLMANILFQSDKKEEIMAEAVRVLKSGGELVIIDWQKGKVGFGPNEHSRIDKDEIQSIATTKGFIQERTLDAGDFHFGIVFKKK